MAINSSTRKVIIFKRIYVLFNTMFLVPSLIFKLYLFIYLFSELEINSSNKKKHVQQHVYSNINFIAEVLHLMKLRLKLSCKMKLIS